MTVSRRSKLLEKLEYEDFLRRNQYYGLLLIGIISTAYHLWFAYAKDIAMDLHLVLHLWLMMLMATLFVFDPSIDRSDGMPQMVDNYVILPLEFVFASVTSIYMYTNWQRLYIDAPGQYTDLDVLMGAILIILVLDLSRRTFGWVITGVGIIGLVYAATASYWPGIFYTRGIPVRPLITGLTVSFTGLYDLIVRVSATYIIIFLLFAGFLESYGALEYFIKIGARIGKKVRSGITQAAVISSLGMGSVNGSAAANAATTGAMTIPLMKSQGIKSDTAGAIEAVASSGGQIMPPVMGAAAFLMAEIIGTSYLRIITIGLLPALVFYLSVVVAVYLISDKENAQAREINVDAVRDERRELGISQKEKLDQISVGTPSTLSLTELSDELEQQQSFKILVFEGFYLWIPVFVLIYTLVVLRYNALTAGFYSTIAAVLSAFVQYIVLGDRISESVRNFIADTADGMRLGSQNAAAIALAAAVMGLFVAVLGITGFTITLTQQMVSIAGGVLLILLPIAMITAILFGLGMPTTGAYLVAVLLIAPALVELGLAVEAAHFFVFYFAILSALTPPVAIANIITSEISGASFITTCYKSILIGAPLFVLPYVFVFNPELLFWELPFTFYLFVVILISFIGLSTVSISYFFGSVGMPVRVLLLLSSLTVMLAPILPVRVIEDWLLQVMGAVVIVLLLGIHVTVLTDRHILSNAKFSQLK